MANYKVDFRDEAILIKAKDASVEILAEIGQVVREEIQASAPRDTGFHAESVTVITPQGSTGEPWPSGQYHSPKTGRLVRRQAAPLASSPDDRTVVVHAPAAHAIHAEVIKPHIYPAAERAAAQAGGIISKVGKRHFG